MGERVVGGRYGGREGRRERRRWEGAKEGWRELGKNSWTEGRSD